MTRSPGLRIGMRGLAALGAVTLGLTLVGTTATAADEVDPRPGLEGSYLDGPSAADGMALLASLPRQAPFDANPGNFSFVNSDLAFTGDHAIVGNYNGFQVYDVSDPAAPVLKNAFVCPGGQGDVSVYGDLLFMSVEETRAKIDCTLSPAPTTQTRMRGVRIFDISNIEEPRLLTNIQTCRGSHTHTVVEDPSDPDNVYIYNSGTGGQRSTLEAVHTPEGFVSGRCGQTLATGANPSQWMIEVIKVPLAAPETASVVKEARLFANPETNAVNGLQNAPTRPSHPCTDVVNPVTGTGTSCTPAGSGYSPQPITNTCHDITAYPEVGLAAGACQGNGILIDISNPADPVRIDAVADPNFAYWHSATFNNDGTKVIFTDEWGGGTGARCTANHREEWGANALFDIVDGKMQFASYYKLPVPQGVKENCVAHNGSLIPVPGRDIMVQAWYQGGTSVIDFTDTANPTEIAFFDRGPVNFPNANATTINLGGYWSTYWYNGHVFGSEIARGFDSLALTPSDQLSANEIAAATEIQFDEFNAQGQPRYDHAPSFAVVRSFVDQAERAGTLTGDALAEVREHLATAEKLLDNGKANKRAVQAQFDNAIRKAGDNTAVVDAARTLWESVR